MNVDTGSKEKMLHVSSMAKRSMALTMLVAVSAAAATCIVHDGVSFAVNVGAVSPSSVAKDIGSRLENLLGNKYGRNDDVSGTVMYQVKLPLGLQGGLQDIPFSKPCGKTFQDVANETWSDGDGGGGGGSACTGGGGLEQVVVGYSPVYRQAQSCTPTGCISQSVFVGYEPVYGYAKTASGIC